MEKLDRPIFLIGAARSGTTLTGEILSAHPDLAYWIEPKYIWKYRKPDIWNDRRSANEASDAVSRYIQKKFRKFTKDCNKTRFLEKTPSNCFRVSFIHKVFPNARFIYVKREGEDVFLSAWKKWTTDHDKTAYRRRLNFRDYPVRDLPFYIFDFGKQYLTQKFFADKQQKWGPMTPEIREVLERSKAEAVAYQWHQSVSCVFSDFQKLPEDLIYEFDYKELLSEPGRVLSEIMEFSELRYSQEVIDTAHKTIDKTNLTKKKDSSGIKMTQRVRQLLNLEQS